MVVWRELCVLSAGTARLTPNAAGAATASRDGDSTAQRTNTVHAVRRVAGESAALVFSALSTGEFKFCPVKSARC